MPASLARSRTSASCTANPCVRSASCTSTSRCAPTVRSTWSSWPGRLVETRAETLGRATVAEPASPTSCSTRWTRAPYVCSRQIRRCPRCVARSRSSRERTSARIVCAASARSPTTNTSSGGKNSPTAALGVVTTGVPHAVISKTRRAHARRVDDRAHVEEHLVLAVRGEHAVVVERPDDARAERLRELVPRPRPGTGEDLETVLHARRDVDGRAEQQVHLRPTLRVLVREVHAAERDVARGPVAVRARGCGSRAAPRTPGPHAVVAQPLAVRVHPPDVGRVHVVEQRRRVEEVLEVRRVLLVPEDRGHAALAARGDELDERRTRGRRPGEVVLPGAPVPVPRGLDEQQVQPGTTVALAVELVAPRRRGEDDLVPLEPEGEPGEVVEDDTDAQVGAGSRTVRDRPGLEGHPVVGTARPEEPASRGTPRRRT